MALVGVVDSMVAARENATKYSYPVSPNRELVAYGGANLLASTLTATGCVPIFGSLTRSRLNGNTGGRTQMAAIVTATLVLLSIFFLLPWLFFLPRVSYENDLLLADISACSHRSSPPWCTAVSTVRPVKLTPVLQEAPHDVIYYWKMRAWPDFIQMAGTFLLTLLFSIEVGVVASVGFSLLLVIQNSTRPRIKIIGRRPDTDEWVPIDEDEEAQEEIPGVVSSKHLPCTNSSSSCASASRSHSPTPASSRNASAAYVSPEERADTSSSCMAPSRATRLTRRAASPPRPSSCTWAM